MHLLYALRLLRLMSLSVLRSCVTFPGQAAMPESIQLENRKRRSRFQAHVQRKLRYSVHMAGDSSKRAYAGYVVLSRCGEPWRYWLYPGSAEAEAKLAELNAEKCADYGCQQLHSTWLEVIPH